MRRESVFLMVFLVFLVDSSFAALEVHSVKASGTIYIRADGSIDPTTAPIQRNGDVYNLTGNITSDADGIVVEKDNIVIDGSGFAIEGPGAGNMHGIYLLRRNYITIQNTNIMNFACGMVLYTSSFNRIYRNNITNNNFGILLVYSSTGNNMNENSIVNNVNGIGFGESPSNTIYDNTIANNSQGISLGYSVSNNSIGGNLIANNGEGIGLDSASSNDIWGNNVTSNGGGIVLRYSSNYNSISRNTIKNNGEGIGLCDSSSNNHIRQNAFVDDNLYVQYPCPNSVENNTVNGRPLVYLDSVADYSIGDAGQIILVRCERIRVEGLNLSRTFTGVQLWETDDCIFFGNTITMNRRYGIELFSSSNNSIGENTIANNKEGIRLHSSSNNSIDGNTLTNNNDYGIWLNSSSDNSMRGNNITNNYVGILLRYSSNNSMNGNTIAENGHGIWVAYSSRHNSMHGNNVISNDFEGILLDSSPNNSISGNTIADNWDGILLSSSKYDSINGNTIINNDWCGIGLDSASSNSISGNTIANNGYGLLLGYSSSNTVCQNNFMNQTAPANNLTPAYASFWDSGCEGNYWSDYNGTDANRDGIGDTPYIIDANNTDPYPLMGTFYGFNVSWIDSGYIVEIISTSSVSAFDAGFWIEHPENPNTRVITFNVTCETDTVGFCRISIPIALLNATYTVLLNGTEIPFTLLPCSNSTHSYLYFNYTHPIQEVMIIQEFPSLIILPLFFTATLLGAAVYRRKPH